MCCMIKKTIEAEKDIQEGSWDSCSLVEVKQDDTFHYYRVTSSAVIDVKVQNGIKLSGTLSK